MIQGSRDDSHSFCLFNYVHSTWICTAPGTRALPSFHHGIFGAKTPAVSISRFGWEEKPAQVEKMGPKSQEAQPFEGVKTCLHVPGAARRHRRRGYIRVAEMTGFVTSSNQQTAKEKTGL